MERIMPTDKRVHLTGRIDTQDGYATLCWCGSQIIFRFFGTRLCFSGENENFGAQSILGLVIDGEESQIMIGGSCEKEITAAENLENREHTAVIYKRMEGHYFTVKAIETDGEFLSAPEIPAKRIEVYGDSVSAGSVVDCEEYVGKSDPEHCGQWDNAWHAYPLITGRMLPAEVYDTSQGGIAIFDRTGYFEMPNTRGMESCYDKSRYSIYKPLKDWDFRFVPHVIIFAIGQNDACPDPDVLRKPEGYEKWVGKYIEIINAVRSHAPKAAVVLALTVLMHDPIWDDALEDIKNRLGGKASLTYHLMYTRTGKATPGHPRYLEQQEMANELTAFLNTLPEKVWEN